MEAIAPPGAARVVEATEAVGLEAEQTVGNAAPVEEEEAMEVMATKASISLLTGEPDIISIL